MKKTQCILYVSLKKKNNVPKEREKFKIIGSFA